MKKIIGTLVPLSAIYSKQDNQHDQGTLKSAMVFLDWLKKTGQSAWQLLPLYTTQLEPGSSMKRVPSPYKSYGIGLDPKYLSFDFAKNIPSGNQLKDFIIENSDWIDDYALFSALANYFKTDDWRLWDDNVKNRDAKALNIWRIKLKDEIHQHIVIQWQLHQAYQQLKNKADKLGIILIGDLPFYLSICSPLVWAFQNIFQLEKDGKMKNVSGSPDYEKELFGRQIWGHPLYNWKDASNNKPIIDFWKIRLSYMAQLYNFIRFDHAKGFYQFGSIDLTDKNNDNYEKGPGESVLAELINFAKEKNVTCFVEDCGRNVQELRQSMDKLNISGIKIFRFAYIKNINYLDKEYADVRYYPINSIAYTTIHDTETLLGNLIELTAEQKKVLAGTASVRYDADDKVLAKRIRNAVIASPARIIIIPIQDWLLTTDRINIPGTETPINDPNWHYKLKVPIEELPTSF